MPDSKSDTTARPPSDDVSPTPDLGTKADLEAFQKQLYAAVRSGAKEPPDAE